PDESRRECEQALEIVRALGVRRFAPFSLIGLARILAFEGRRAEAHAVAERAVAACRDTGLAFLGPLALGVLARVTRDAATRARALAEGMELLGGGAVGHNYLHFYRDAMEASLESGALDDVERYAAALEDYTRPEPL